MTTLGQHVVFRVIDEVYALSIMHIQEIIKMKEIFETPNSSRNYLKGVINVRGNIIPVISLSERFGYAQSPPTRNSRIIITKVQDQFVGIIVDAIEKVEKLEDKPLPDTINEKLRATSQAISYMGNTIVPILDIHQVLEIGGENK